MRARCSGDLTKTGAQKSGAITAKYTAMCASPPMSDGVIGWNSITASSDMTAATQLCVFELRTSTRRLELPPRERRQADRERR